MTILIIAIASIIALRTAIGLYNGRSREVRTIVITDGDSVTIEGKRCRLAGIDAPEWNSPFGRAARAHLARLAHAHAPLTYRVIGRDKFGRASIQLQGRDLDLNKLMVEAGYARAYTRYSWSYIFAERRARKAGRGVWATGDFPMPENVRHPA